MGANTTLRAFNVSRFSGVMLALLATDASAQSANGEAGVLKAMVEFCSLAPGKTEELPVEIPDWEWKPVQAKAASEEIEHTIASIHFAEQRLVSEFPINSMERDWAIVTRKNPPGTTGQRTENPDSDRFVFPHENLLIHEASGSVAIVDLDYLALLPRRDPTRRQIFTSYYVGTNRCDIAVTEPLMPELLDLFKAEFEAVQPSEKPFQRFEIDEIETPGSYMALRTEYSRKGTITLIDNEEIEPQLGSSLPIRAVLRLRARMALYKDS